MARFGLTWTETGTLTIRQVMAFVDVLKADDEAAGRAVAERAAEEQIRQAYAARR